MQRVHALYQLCQSHTSS